MNNKILMYFVTVFSTLILVSCASTTKITELSAEVQELSTRLDQLNSNVDILKPEIEQAKNEAHRANKRLDNQISLYRK
ncbi:major outer membrane lipoprotein [Candidatus Blochmanniella vafra str. BVAF]|uniref:Major outer membrane lipoprotein Lpp n=1 Tax=Blochmanniella vafra (strain BVAF) TaxID=859654 RepID=E8Q667_BLOVB|nr:LPP leucine zipper domain-containing protein [Candidatus Blochmannia vafer]ADV33761.1 major outer membrane lipoprotein [Candidatus Blochmannia vafer str. BVAF]